MLFNPVYLIIPFLLSAILLFTARRLFFKGLSITALLKPGAQYHDNPVFNRDFKLFFIIIRIFFFVALADLLLAPPEFSFLFSMILLLFPSLILMKWVVRGVQYCV